MTRDSPKLLYKYLQIINPDLKDRTHLLQSLLVRCPIRRLQRAYNILGSIDDGCLDSQSMAELLDSLLQRRLQALRLAAVVPADRLAMLVDHLARGLEAIGLLAVLFHLDDAQAQNSILAFESASIWWASASSFLSHPMPSDWIMFSAPVFTFISICSCFSSEASTLSLAVAGAPPSRAVFPPPKPPTAPLTKKPPLGSMQAVIDSERYRKD